MNSVMVLTILFSALAKFPHQLFPKNGLNLYNDQPQSLVLFSLNFTVYFPNELTQ